MVSVTNLKNGDLTDAIRLFRSNPNYFDKENTNFSENKTFQFEALSCIIYLIFKGSAEWITLYFCQKGSLVTLVWYLEILFLKYSGKISYLHIWNIFETNFKMKFLQKIYNKVTLKKDTGMYI